MQQAAKEEFKNIINKHHVYELKPLPGPRY